MTISYRVVVVKPKSVEIEELSAGFGKRYFAVH